MGFTSKTSSQNRAVGPLITREKEFEWIKTKVYRERNNIS